MSSSVRIGVLEQEGVIKFRAEHASCALPRRSFGDAANTLRAWRQILYALELVGQDPLRYDGAGYGNVSARVGPPSASPGRRAFLVSGTQTGGNREVSYDDLCLVNSYDIRLNTVRSEGPVSPSSESLTHGAIYDLSPRIRFVLHVHSPLLWRAAKSLRLPTSEPTIGYGTVEMAREVRRLYRVTHLSDCQVLAMGGHEDGIIAFGHTCDGAAANLMTLYAAALRETLS